MPGLFDRDTLEEVTPRAERVLPTLQHLRLQN
jgi:hypothetical protein